jgi:hypothetical protein
MAGRIQISHTPAMPNDKADPRAEVVAKAVKDPAFRSELKKDPAAAIEKATGLKLPAGVVVKVVEDTASVVHLVLPPDPKSLSESALKSVAGGAGIVTQFAGCMDANTTSPSNCRPR